MIRNTDHASLIEARNGCTVLLSLNNVFRKLFQINTIYQYANPFPSSNQLLIGQNYATHQYVIYIFEMRFSNPYR